MNRIMHWQPAEQLKKGPEGCMVQTYPIAVEGKGDLHGRIDLHFRASQNRIRRTTKWRLDSFETCPERGILAVFLEPVQEDLTADYDRFRVWLEGNHIVFSICDGRRAARHQDHDEDVSAAM